LKAVVSIYPTGKERMRTKHACMDPLYRTESMDRFLISIPPPFPFKIKEERKKEK